MMTNGVLEAYSHLIKRKSLLSMWMVKLSLHKVNMLLDSMFSLFSAAKRRLLHAKFTTFLHLPLILVVYKVPLISFLDF